MLSWKWNSVDEIWGVGKWNLNGVGIDRAGKCQFFTQSKSFKHNVSPRNCVEQWTCSTAESLVWKSALKAQLTWIGKNISPSAPPASQYILIIITEAPIVIFGFNVLLLMAHRQHPPTDLYCPIVGKIYPLPLYIFNLHIFCLAKIFLCEIYISCLTNLLLPSHNTWIKMFKYSTKYSDLNQYSPVPPYPALYFIFFVAHDIDIGRLSMLMHFSWLSLPLAV